MREPGMPPVIGIIGGSGIYEIMGLTDTAWQAVETPFGLPSDDLLFGKLDSQKIVFLPRHGRGHRLSPSDINFRANIFALKQAGVTEVISMSACGSFEEKLSPGTFVLIDQFIDRTFLREKTFFGDGLVGHVSIAHPICSRVADALEESAKELAIDHVRGGCYLAIEGPQFSTLAESELYKAWGCQVVGMTNMPEAKLAREAELCYATVAMVTDYDCWHPEHEAVTVDQVVNILMGNADKARALVKSVIPKLSERSSSCKKGCHTALDTAFITAPEARDPKVIRRLGPLLERALGS